MIVSLKMELEVEKSFKQVEIEFPIFLTSGFNSESSQTRRSVKEDSVRFEMKKIVSPTEYFELEKRTSIKSNGKKCVSFEMTHEIDNEPDDSPSHYGIGDDCYNKPSTQEAWDCLVAEAITQLENLA